MPLKDGYGAVIGTLHSYSRDPVNDYGQYYPRQRRGADPRRHL